MYGSSQTRVPQVESADAAIVGGGPAGCTAAILLKQYNPSARIVLFEKEKFPRHHVGESTLPDANAVLQKIGVIEALNRAGFPIKCGICYKWRHNRPVFADVFSRGVHPNLQDRLYPKGIPEHSWQVERGQYDAILLQRARDVGIEVHEETSVVGAVLGEGERVVGVRFLPNRETEIQTLKSRHVIDASGQGRKMAAWLGIACEKFPLGDTALYRYYTGFKWNPELIGSFYDGKIFFTAVPRGWIWFIPISNDTVSVGLVTKKSFMENLSPDEAVEAELQHAPEMREMLAGARQISHRYSSNPAATYVIQDWTYQNARMAGPGWYAVGDAAAFVDPILSSGLNLAHNCALLAANAINTEWNHPDIPVTAVQEGYQGFYREIYRSFLAMAAWWYERRDTEISDWWKVAREQSKNPSAMASLSDRQAFLTFTAGYVTDFRFINVGAGGFGAQGLNQIFDDIPDQPIEFKLHRPDMEVEKPLHRAFDGYEVSSYYGSHVGTNRWWKLPLITFCRGVERIPFYPAIMESEDREDDLLADLSARIVASTLAQLDGKRNANQVARAIQADFGGFDQKIHRCAMKFMHNLITVGLLEVAGA